MLHMQAIQNTLVSVSAAAVHSYLFASQNQGSTEQCSHAVLLWASCLELCGSQAAQGEGLTSASSFRMVSQVFQSPSHLHLSMRGANFVCEWRMQGGFCGGFASGATLDA
jgi:hypothetical protein